MSVLGSVEVEDVPGDQVVVTMRGRVGDVLKVLINGLTLESLAVVRDAMQAELDARKK